MFLKKQSLFDSQQTMQELTCLVSKVPLDVCFILLKQTNMSTELELTTHWKATLVFLTSKCTWKARSRFPDVQFNKTCAGLSQICEDPNKNMHIALNSQSNKGKRFDQIHSQRKENSLPDMLQHEQAYFFFLNCYFQV